jgi:hypothetical protein
MGQACTISLSAVVCSANHGLLEVCSCSAILDQTFESHNYSGSGSTYVYGYCDATYKEGWGRDETVEFVKNSMFLGPVCHDIPFTSVITI